MTEAKTVMSAKSLTEAVGTKPEVHRVRALEVAPDPSSHSVPAVTDPTPRFWLWGACGVLLSALAGLVYFQPWVTPPTEVVVETMALRSVSRVLAVNGRIAGERSVELRPEDSGRLTEVPVAEGDKVLSGAAVAKIDASAQEAVVRQAMAGLDAAQVAEAEAEATYDRTKALGANVTRVALDSAARSAQAANEEVARMTALLDQAAIQLQKYTLRAPISGTVLDLTAEPGARVDPTTILMTIVDLQHLVVETDVDETYATQIKLGQPAALRLSGETVVRPGKVSFVSLMVDEATGGLAVELRPDDALVAPIGLTVTANITVEDHPSALTVPRAAILRDGTGDAVLVVADGVAQRRAVTPIEWPADWLIVIEGLAAGDIVISDATGLADGQAVRLAP